MKLKQIVRRPTVDDSHLSAELPAIIKQIYARRGVQANKELQLSLANLVNITLLKGLDDACEVLFETVQAQEKIIVIGDFDADGATSTALMMEALTLLGNYDHEFLVPNRFDYGYGLSPEIAQEAINNGAKLIITVDNGISCHRGVDYAKSQGCRVIVTDHHMPGAVLPNADAIINPNQHHCTFPSKNLAGVGVAFYFMMAFRQYLRQKNWFFEQGFAEPNLAQLLDLVALGTVADVVSLDANNRILVNQGLQRIRAGLVRPGIQALIDVAGRQSQHLQASDFGFAIGPRINAAGRLDDMTFGIQCLLAKDSFSAQKMAMELDGLNKARREIEQGIQVEAEAIVSHLSTSTEQTPRALALYQADWHQGVIGIVAGRLKEKFYCPSVVFAAASDEVISDVDAEIKGSARSIPGLHIRDLLEAIDTQYPDLIIKFGGHAMAAGLSISAGNFARFKEIFESMAVEWTPEDDLAGAIFSDGELQSFELTMEFALALRNAGPWGQNFPEPIFDGVFDIVQQRIVGEKHLKLVVGLNNQVFDAIAFNVDVKQWPNASANRVHLAYKLDINEFRGKRTLQLMVESIQAV